MTIENNQIPNPLPKFINIKDLIGLQIGPVTIFPPIPTHRRTLDWDEMAPVRVLERMIQCRNTFKDVLDTDGQKLRARENPRIELLLYLHKITHKERRQLTAWKRLVQELINHYGAQVNIDPGARPSRR